MNNTNVDVLRFVADNAGLDIFQALIKAYNQGFEAGIKHATTEVTTDADSD